MSDPGVIDRALRDSELRGLAYALYGRTAALLLVALWFALAWQSPNQPVIVVAVLAFTAIGLGHLWLSRRPAYRRWWTWAFFSIDIAAVACVFAFVPLTQGGDVPQIFAFRVYGIHYFLLILGAAVLTLQPGLILWAGGMIAAAWWGAWLYVVAGMARRVTWSDIPGAPAPGEYLGVFMDPDFTGRGSRIEETAIVMGLAALLAISVSRARRVVRDLAATQEERAFVTRAFSQYVPEAVVQALVKNRAALAPVRREASVLFLDIQGFSTFAEDRAPEAVITTLNGFFDAATEVLARHGGVVVNLQGDALLAVFNVPLDLDDHAGAAIRAARDLLHLTAGESFDGQRFTIRIGVNTGPVAAGSAGGRGRQSYTVYGDAVNVAARLEQANKETGTRVLIAEASVTAARDKAGLLPVGTISVRGRAASVSVWTLAGGDTAQTPKVT